MPETTATPRATGTRALTAVKVDAGRDRRDAALQIADWRFECKVSGQDTEGRYCIFDTVRTGRGGPPLHIHHDQDEWFYVRDGEFVFLVGDETYHLKPGDSLLGPRKIPHAFTSITDNSALLIVFQPAGEMEQLFFKAWQTSQLRPLTSDDWRMFGRAHGVDIVGPPLVLD
jgi:mannose-6-phosphate isomerase-like protein (cupin superfamily)